VTTRAERPLQVIEPRQARSRATLDRLLDAAEDLLDERSLDEIPIADIVARANSSVGSFYARFPSKEALAVALLQRYYREGQEGITNSLAIDTSERGDLESIAHDYIRRVVNVCRRRRGLLRLRLRRRILPGESILPDETERDRTVVASLRDLFEPVRGEIQHPDAEQALSFALRVVDSVAVTSIVLDGVSDSFGAMSDDALVCHLVELVISYLRARVKKPH